MAKKSCIILMAVCFLTGCLGSQTATVKQTTYYTLEYPPQPAGTPATFPAVLRMNPLEYPADPAGRDMIYRSGPYSREAYRYHRWQLPPGEMVQTFLLRDIRDAKLFQAVLSPEEEGTVQYVLNGLIEQFIEREDQGKFFADLGISMTLTERGSGDKPARILFQKAYRTSEPLASKAPADLAKGMSAAMARVSGEVLKDISKAVMSDR